MRTALSGRELRIASLPEDRLTPEHFSLVTGVPVTPPQPGEALVRTILVSLDPVNRGLMRGGGGYRGGLHPGQVMAGYGIGEVLTPGTGGLAPGSLVFGELGWREYATVPAAQLMPITPRGPLSHHMSVLGLTGMTAYFGLLAVGRPQPGQTVVVSAAAGATGNVAAQLARAHGCRVVGITGGAAKAQVLSERLGLDAVIDRHDGGLRAALRRHCPDGIDVYFDSVGGALLEACLVRMAIGGCVVCCGTLADYDTGAAPRGPRGVPGLIVSKRLRLEGFVVLDYADRWPAAIEELAAKIAARELIVLEEVIDGLERAPAAYVDLLAGGNLGKRMVRVAPDPP